MNNKLMSILLLCSTTFSYAQFGGLSGKIKDKVSTKTKETKIDPSLNTQAVVKTEETTDEIVSPIHKKYVNKIVFTSQPLSKDEVKESDFLQNYTMGKPLAIRVYMDNSLTNYLINGYPNKEKSDLITMGTYNIRFFIDDVDSYQHRFTKNLFEKEEKNKFTTWKSTFVNTNGADTEFTIAWNEFKKKAYNKLSVGPHKIKIEVSPDIQCLSCSTTNSLNAIASGEININVVQNIVDVNDPSICMPTPTISDIVLEKEFLNLTSKQNTAWKEESYKVSLKSPDWILIRNDFDRVLSKKRHAYVGLKDGESCFYMLFTFSKEFDGINYGKTKVIGYENKREIPCDCLK